LNANSSSSSSSSSKSEKHFNRETADAQVIRDLKAEVSTLRSAVHKANLSNQNSRSPGSVGRDVSTVDSNTYSIMQQQLRDLQNRERIQVSATHKQDVFISCIFPFSIGLRFLFISQFSCVFKSDFFLCLFLNVF
jgi:hypothetical protein